MNPLKMQKPFLEKLQITKGIIAKPFE